MKKEKKAINKLKKNKNNKDNFFRFRKLDNKYLLTSELGDYFFANEKRG